MTIRRIVVIPAIAVSILCILVAGAVHPPKEERCRRVQLTGTIKVTPKPKPGFRGTALGSEGKFKMDLIFAEKGGEVLYQKNTLELVQVTSYSFGGARPCKNTLHDDAKATRAFTIWAKLLPDEVVISDANDKVKSVQDQFDMLLKIMPTFAPITYTAQCEGGRPGDVSDFGMSYVQLLQVFHATQYSGNVLLNKFGDKKSLPNVDLFGAMTADVEWEVLETLVPCKNFQYK
jgi:hypothetical protein